MQIPFIIFNPNDDGSVMHATRRQVEWLVANGVRVRVIANEEPRGWRVDDVELVTSKSRLTERCASYAVNGAARRISRRFARWDPRAYFAQVAFDAAASARLRELANKNAFDVAICVQHFCAPGLRRLQNSHGVPFILVAHGDIFSHPPDSFTIPLTYLYRTTAREAYRHASQIIAVGTALREQAIRCGAALERVTVIPNGIDVADLQGETHPSAGRRYGCELLYVGRLSPEKGVEVLLRSLAGAPLLNSRLRIVGDGPSSSSLGSLGKSIATQVTIEFVGRVSRSALGAFYRSSDVVVLPSFTEAQPVVTLEAMAFGVPIVASRVGGVPDTVEDGTTGLLVPAGDEGALRSAIVTLAGSSELRSSMAAQALTASRRYDWSTILTRFMSVVQNTCTSQAAESRRVVCRKIPT